ncbi:MAG TPA: tetratricopeptide repeat protein [Drouetiella sp.]|jgi:Tetratricopeptide repeat
MVSVNRSLRYLTMVGSAFVLAGSCGLAALADGDILPPPPPDEDTPKPVFDRTKYVQTYPIRKPGTTTTTTSTVAIPPTPSVPVTTTTTSTTSTTVQTQAAPVTVTTVTPSSSNVSIRPANAAAQVLLNRAYDQMRKNQFTSAVKLLNDAVRADANSVIARRYLAYALIRIAKPADALNQLVFLTNMLKPNAPTTFDNFNLGEAYLSLRNYSAAEDAFKSVVALEPRNDAARGDLIKAYAYDSKFPEAMSQLTIGQQNRDPRVQRYYRTLLELIYNAKTAAAVNSTPTTTTVTETTNTWQQISPK